MFKRSRKGYKSYLNKFGTSHGLYSTRRSSGGFRLKPLDGVLIILPILLALILFLPQNTGVRGTGGMDGDGTGRSRDGQGDTQPGVIEYEGKLVVKVYFPQDNKTEEMTLEDYVVGVLAAEMPASFHEEALKAQAVAARTFAFSRMLGLYVSKESHNGADVCTDSTHCQAYMSKEQYLERSGKKEDWSKFEKAVKATKNQVITYEKAIINPLYHANSGGVTEDVEAVWSVSGQVPYLKSVYSPDESTYSNYAVKSVFSWDDIKAKVLSRYKDAVLGEDARQELEIKTYSASGRVAEIRTGSVVMGGPVFRELLNLRSTNFEITMPDEKTVEITTTGFGHGVGMSQCGADVLGREGLGYMDILKYYYTGVSIDEIKQ